MAGRKVRDRAEARRLLARWQKSGQSLSDFCVRHQINVHSLSAYRSFVLTEQTKTTEESDFIEVKIAQQLPTTTATYRVDLPNGLAVTLSDDFTPQRLHHLLKILQTC